MIQAFGQNTIDAGDGDNMIFGGFENNVRSGSGKDWIQSGHSIIDSGGDDRIEAESSLIEAKWPGQ